MCSPECAGFVGAQFIAPDRMGVMNRAHSEGRPPDRRGVYGSRPGGMPARMDSAQSGGVRIPVVLEPEKSVGEIIIDMPPVEKEDAPEQLAEGQVV